MNPNTGNADCDKWIVDTFRRSTRKSELTGATVQELLIRQPGQLGPVVLNEDQLRGLIRYLVRTFCAACGGTGFDPDSLEGKCEYCRDDLPF